MGGKLQDRHDAWNAFRLALEPFLGRCRAAGQCLLTALQELARLDTFPDSVTAARSLIAQHDACVRRAFDNPGLADVQRDAEETLRELRNMGDTLQYSHDYTCAMSGAEQLFTQVQETTFRLTKLADERLHRLEQCLQVRQFEEQSSKVMAWLETDGEELLAHHQDVCDNLKGIKAQQKDFDKLYFSAMTHIEKGNDMLEEAGMLTQSGNFDQVTGIKEIAKELKSRLRHFTTRLDELKDKIENTAKCYHLLDKAYEWALDAMKHVAGMKMDSTSSPEEVEKLMTSLSVYLKEHPPITTETFNIMTELSETVENEKLQDQCKVAQSRCRETAHLLKVRLSTLHQAREQLENEQHRRRSSYNLSCGATYYPSIEDNEPFWQRQTSTPLGLPNISVRRRSYSGKPSAPLYSPGVAAFRDTVKETDLSEIEEYLFNEGLITEDMSNRIVACLPKGLSDTTLRSSRESLRGSRESLRGSMENLDRDEKSSSVPKELPASVPTDFGSYMEANLGSSKHSSKSPPQRKFLRHSRSGSAMSALADVDVEPRTSQTSIAGRGIKSLSMITGSSESLPSLAEEEEIQGETAPAATGGNATNGAGTERKFVWTPVPVNTHLSGRPTRPGLTSYHSMSDLSLTSEQIKRKRNLALVMSEMLQTERDYVRSLQFVIENYLPELLRDDVPQALRGKRNVIFGNVEQIHAFHSRYFLRALERCENNPVHVARVFLEHANEFYLYALYNKNKPKSDELMTEWGAKFFREKQVSLGDRMDLSSYLLKPVQRMGKYALLLKQILKECPENEQQDFADLSSAVEMVKFQLRHGNDLLAMDSIRHCDVNLQEQGRLLRQEEYLVWHGRRKCLRRIFLFEDLLLFAKPKRSSSGHDVYVYKGSIKTSDMGLTENLGDSPFRFEIWFRKRTAGGAYVLQAPSFDIKNAWVMEISRLLWKQAILNRENRLSEMARMGIGNKPCLDIKPSKNNINDRFVNIQHRIPRSRNSIAVSSVEHLKNGAKRPHSIISVSSCSSSSSSGHSSGFGAMTIPGLETMPEDVAFMPGARTSLTLCSNESGISLGSGGSSPPSMVDGFTQTTLGRPSKRVGSGVVRLSDSGVSSDYSLPLTVSTSTATTLPDSDLLSTDV